MRVPKGSGRKISFQINRYKAFAPKTVSQGECDMTGSALVPSDGSPSTGTETDSDKLLTEAKNLRGMVEVLQEGKKRKTYIFYAAVVLAVVTLIYQGMTGFSYSSDKTKVQLACIDLKKAQPTAKCPGEDDYTPLPPAGTSQVQPAATTTKETSNLEVVNLTHGGFWERATGPSFKVCTGSSAMNMCPTITKLEGGEVSPQTCPDGKRAILLPAGSCAIATPKGATS